MIWSFSLIYNTTFESSLPILQVSSIESCSWNKTVYFDVHWIICEISCQRKKTNWDITQINKYMVYASKYYVRFMHLNIQLWILLLGDFFLKYIYLFSLENKTQILKIDFIMFESLELFINGKIFEDLWLHCYINTHVACYNFWFRYWSPIDEMLREAAVLREVKVRLLIGLWTRTHPLTFNFMTSMQALCTDYHSAL